MTTKKTTPAIEQEETAAQKAVKRNKTTPADFPIVGIGASAGGLEALQQFFENMPNDNGMAFVVVQHLDPTHTGMMPELLQRITAMKVFQASDGLKVKPNYVYVIPPNKSLSILNGALHLFDPVELRGLRLPIDIFFRSLAIDREEKSIGIILSGMGSDGSLGLKAIKEKNGSVLIQSPASAKFDGMPCSAIDAVIADVVAPVEELPARLIAFLKYIPAIKTDPELDDKNRSSLDKIIILLREQSGHDFSLYKHNTLLRRIERRKGIHQIDKISNYIRYCQDNPKEVDVLFKELLIGVTSFFRDPEVWKKLKEVILPALISKMPDNFLMRAWVTACSTGEEAISLAIIFKEVMETIKPRRNLSLQIFATDLDSDAIDIARKGIYPANIVADVSNERLSRFFTPEAGGFRISTSIREMMVFAVQNVIKDPPFTKLEFLSCRNMMIYMEPVLQNKLISLFNYSMNPEGILLLGSAETLGNKTDGFEKLDTRLKIYKRKLTTRTPELIDFPSSFQPKKPVKTQQTTAQTGIDTLQNQADQLILQRYAPPSVLVNEKGDILYITGRTGKYLEPVAGKANWNLFSMAREGLRELLPGAFRRVLKNYEAVVIQNCKVGTNGGTQYVDVTIQRIENPDALRGKTMVVFTDVHAPVENNTTNLKSGKRAPTGKMKGLEFDLQRTLEDLQSTREEMQTSQEELKSTNEELQSSNEELQSANEELTSSKEEMQSLNEELQTVNIELQSKVGDFVQASNDMKNLLNSTEIATLFLDKELNIRRYTEKLNDLIKLRHTDEGRPFTDLVSDLVYPEIESHARMVLKTLSTVESSITTSDGRWFVVRIMPYCTTDDRIDGLVITFTDITAAKKLEFEVKKNNDVLKISEVRYRNLFSMAKDGILILDADTGVIVDVNPFLIELLGYSEAEFVEKAIWEIGFLRDVIASKEKFIELQEKEFVRYENLPLETADGRKIEVEFISNLYVVDNHKIIQCFIRQSLTN